MKSISNQNGYTLLLTLLLVVIISGFIGTLSLLTLTQQKQVEKTDDRLLLSDITDMGVEAYKAQVLNLFFEEVNKANLEVSLLEKDLDFEKNANDIEDYALLTIKNKILNLTKYPPPISDNIKYQLDKEPIITDSGNNLLVTMYISGLVNNKTEQYLVKFKLPNNIYNITVTKDGSTGESNESFVIPPNFEDTLPTPFPPTENDLCPSKKNEWFSGIICNSSSPFDIDYLYNSTVYLTKSSTFSNANNNNYGKSTLYVNGNLNMSNLNSNGNISFYIKGEADFDNLNNAENVIIQGTDNASFNNLNNINSLSIMLNGSGSFHNIGGQNFTLYTKGDASFGNINNLSESNIEVRGTTVFNQNIQFKNVKSHHVDSSLAQQIQLDNTIMIFESSLSQKGAFQVKNNSKVCIRNSSSLGMLDIDATSKFYIKDTSSVTYSLQGGSRLPIILDSTKFEEFCTLGSSGDSEGQNYEVELDGSINLISIENQIEYDIQN